MVNAQAHVALLVDFANLRQQLTPDGGAMSPGGRAVAGALVAYAGGIGRVGVARAYADWTREPELSRELGGTRLSPILVPATEDGEDRSHIRLTVDAMESLFNGDEPDAFVLVSSDASLVPLVQALRTDGSEVIVVASGSTPVDELVAEADRFISLEEILAGATAEPLVLRPGREHGAPTSNGAARPAPAAHSDSAAPRAAAEPILREPEFENYDWARFIRLVDELEQRLPFVGVRYLVNKVLGPHNCGIDDPRIKRDLINEAVDEGLIEMYTVGNVNERTDPVTACRLDRHNALVSEVLGEDEDNGLEDDRREDAGEADNDAAGNDATDNDAADNEASDAQEFSAAGM